MEKCNENVVEWLKDEKRATLTSTQGRYRTKIKKLAKAHPQECEIVAENKDGSIVAHIPVSWIKISPLRKVSDEQKEQARERIMEVNRRHANT